MADDMQNGVETAGTEVVSRIYEIGYHITPSVKEEDLEKVVSGIRSEIEKVGGSFIAEGAPAFTRLAYPMTIREGDKKVEYDRGYFGWIKFESSVPASQTITEAMKLNANILRYLVFQTVREDTRAKMKPPTLREVKRTDMIKAAPRRAEEESATPVSEADLDKALQDITTE